MTRVLDGQTIGGSNLRLVRTSAAPRNDYDFDESIGLQVICLDYERQLRQRLALLVIVGIGFSLHCWAGRVGGMSVDVLILALLGVLLYRVVWLIQSG